MKDERSRIGDLGCLSGAFPTREEDEEWSARVERRIGRLQQLIAEADRAAARLEAALAWAERRQPGADPAGRKLDSRVDPPDTSRRVASQAEALKLVSGPGRPSLAREQTADQPPSPDRPPPEVRYQEIYALADRGFDAAEISRRLGQPVGEVELILGLRGTR